MIKCLGIFHKKTPSRKKFRRNSVIKADSLSELKIAVDHQSKLCSSRLADTVFSAIDQKEVIIYALLTQMIELFLCCMKTWKTGSGGEVVTSPPLYRKVGCSRPTMIHARCLRVKQHYPAQKIFKKIACCS